MQTLTTDFSAVLEQWGQAGFDTALLEHLAKIEADELPLQQVLSYSSISTGRDISFMVLSRQADTHAIHVKLGVFFKGIIAGCNCADDPTPLEENNEYGEFLLTIHRTNGQASVGALT